MKERKRKHDDVHFPLQGRGKKATKRKPAQALPICPDCQEPQPYIHLCKGTRIRQALSEGT